MCRRRRGSERAPRGSVDGCLPQDLEGLRSVAERERDAELQGPEPDAERVQCGERPAWRGGAERM